MLKKMVLAAALALAATTAHASIDVPVPVNAYITFGTLDWAWANPCDPGPGGNTCGAIDLSYQGTQGWRVATADDFVNGPTFSDFFFVGANVPGGGSEAVTGATFFGANNSAAACATPWFSDNFTHCDLGDGQNGNVWNMPGTQNQGVCCHETWVVRNSNGGGAVPEPATWSLMISGFGIAGAMLRRRKVIAA